MEGIYPYLTFNGNCRKGMNFYKKCLGGELYFQTIGESPHSENLPQEMRDRILHATLRRDDFILMGTDMVGEQGLLKGNAMSLALSCSTEKELHSCYRKLVYGGQRLYPLKTTASGGSTAMLTDRYGYTWILYCL